MESFRAETRIFVFPMHSLAQKDVRALEKRKAWFSNYCLFGHVLTRPARKLGVGKELPGGERLLSRPQLLPPPAGLFFAGRASAPVSALRTFSGGKAPSSASSSLS